MVRRKERRKKSVDEGKSSGKEEKKGRRKKSVDESTDREKEKDERPRIKFGIPWMDEAYNSLTYPDPTCVEVMQKVSKTLANWVGQPQGSELKQQALFSLLGPEYTDQNFPYHKYNVKILDTPKINPQMKEKYIKEMRDFLMKALDQALKDCQYPKDLEGYDKDNELGRYLQKIRKSFREGLKSYTDEVLHNERREKEDRKRKEKEAKRAARSDSSDDSDSDDESDTDKLDRSTKPSDICSEALLALMANNNDKQDKYMEKIREKHLGFSVPFRQHFWLEYLKGKEIKKKRVKEDEDAMKAIEKNFQKVLSKEMKSQKISRAIRSNSWKAIDNTVIERYNNTSSLRLLDNDEHLIQTVRALNIHTVHNKNKYHETYINWLMPLQMAYPLKDKSDEDAHVKKLAIYLELVTNYCKPPIPIVFTLADSIVDTVKVYDEEYYDHIVKCMEAQVNRINVKDFPIEVLLEDQKDAAELYHEIESQDSVSKIDEEDLEIFTDPTIFVRMWITQGYAGVLSVPAGLWVWDELFMHNWSHKYMKDVGVAILSLIKPWMLRANMYSGARKVFLDEPGKIYLSDLRKSVMHLQEGGDYDELPDNKNYIPPKAGAKNKKDKDEDKEKEKGKSRRKGKGKAKKEKEKEKPIKSGARTSVILPFAADRLFDVELNLDSDSSDSDSDFEITALPVFEPEPDTESNSEPEPEQEPEPEPVAPIPRQRTPTPPPPDNIAWLPYNKKNSSSLPSATRVSDPCDIYIDSVRFLPDNISHCKITGRIVNMYLSQDKNIPDILAFPLMDSQTRCPKFRFKMCLNKTQNGERQFLNPEVVIILRVYGYENLTKKVVVVGSCLARVFRSELKPPKLCVGGWQLRVRHGLPNPEGGLQDLVYTDMDENTPIFGTTICIRFLPASEEYVPAPDYKTGYYKSDKTVPTESEKRIYNHYVSQDKFMTSLIGDHLREMLSLEEGEELPNGPELQSYMEHSLDQKAQQRITREQAPNIDYTHFIHYCPKIGLKANVLAVFGLPVFLENRFCQVYCEVLPGDDTKYKRQEDGYGGYQRFITNKVSFVSAQRSPEWADEGASLHPHYDDKSVLLVRVFGFKPRYTPGNGSYPGVLKDAKNDTISFKYDSPMAWGVVPLFDKGSVISGVHWVPLYKGKPDLGLLDMLEKASPVHKVMLLASKKEMVKLLDGGASLEVKLWDGHMSPHDLRDGRHEDQIDETDQVEKYVKMHKTVFSQSIDEFILENMNDRLKKEGPIGERFERERHFFEAEMNYQFLTAMNEALRNAGKDPLPES